MSNRGYGDSAQANENESRNGARGGRDGKLIFLFSPRSMPRGDTSREQPWRPLSYLYASAIYTGAIERHAMRDVGVGHVSACACMRVCCGDGSFFFAVSRLSAARYCCSRVDGRLGGFLHCVLMARWKDWKMMLM